MAACHFIKIDVEGMEGDVLAGAVETINRFRPALYVENDRKEKSTELIERLLGLDYRLYWHLPPLFNRKNFAGHEEDVFGQIVSVNMLCLPGRLRRTLRASARSLRPKATGDDEC